MECRILILIAVLISCSTSAIVKWLPNTSFNLAINFKGGKLPCSSQLVVFPENIVGSVRLETGVSIGGLILPVNGDIVLDADNEIISLGEDLGDTNCTDRGNVYYMNKQISSWNQPDVWSSPKFNEATPDAERVPCFDDEVEFPANAQFIVILPDVPQHVQALKIGGINYDTYSFRMKVIGRFQQYQHFVLNLNENSGILVEQKQCQTKQGCPCQYTVMKIHCSAKYCSEPTCISPIQPIGHCCKICGGVISYDIDENFDLTEFSNFVEKMIDSYGKEKLVYHVGRIPPNKVQLVVVDKGEYTGTSAEVVNAIDNGMERRWVQGVKLAEISGSPLYKSGMGVKIFVSMFFAVVLVMGSIYVYYYKLPEFRYPVSGRNVFSRYQQRTDSIVSLTRRDSGATLGVATGFRNPLYDSKRGRVQLAESRVEE